MLLNHLNYLYLSWGIKKSGKRMSEDLKWQEKIKIYSKKLFNAVEDAAGEEENHFDE
jgi:hypothetical protein